ncbi:glycoside hydrolase family 6 protein, partial [Streptomyces sp. NPDC046924]
ETADPLVDAYLWVKRPGESDGECKGGPKAGESS